MDKNHKVSSLVIFHCTAIKPGHYAVCFNFGQLFVFYSYLAE